LFQPAGSESFGQQQYPDASVATLPKPFGNSPQSIPVLRQDYRNAFLFRLRHNLQVVDDNGAAVLTGRSIVLANGPEQCGGFDGVRKIVGLNSEILERQVTDGLAHFKLTGGHGGNPHWNLLRKAMTKIINRHRMIWPVRVGK
jgi:hypothetical protein